MPFLIADVAFYEERLVVFIIILNLLLDLMELGKGLNGDFAGHSQKVIPPQDEHLTEVSGLNCRLPRNIREKTYLAKVLVLDKVDDVGLSFLINYGDLARDNEEYFLTEVTLNHAIVINRIDSLLENETKVTEELNGKPSKDINALKNAAVEIHNDFPA